MNKIEKAKDIGLRIHAKQLYGNGKPYSVHLEEVVDVLVEFGFDPNDEENEDLFAAAWLHDGVEDQNLSLQFVEDEISLRTRNLIWRVTNEEGKNRKERAEKTHPKIRSDNPFCGDKSALSLKLADRVANVRHSAKDSPGLFRMYRKEYSVFRKALFQDNASERQRRMWLELDSFLGEQDELINLGKKALTKLIR